MEIVLGEVVKKANFLVYCLKSLKIHEEQGPRVWEKVIVNACVFLWRSVAEGWEL